MENGRGNIFILGSGPSGMGAALELNKLGKPFTVLEKDTQVGGLAKTLQFGDFRTDIGPHKFISQNRYLNYHIEALLGKHNLKVDRLTRFYIQRKFLQYPINLKNLLRNIGAYRLFIIAFDIASDILIKKIKAKIFKKRLITFKDYSIYNFGRFLSELNILNYTEKIFGLDCAKMSSDWAEQRLRGATFSDAVKVFFLKPKDRPRTLVESFCYPDKGIGLIYEKVKEKVLGSGDCVFMMNSCPYKIICKDNKIAEIAVKSSENLKIYKAKHIISSIPLNEFIDILEPRAPSEIQRAVKSLKFRSHVCLFITLNKSNIFSDQWICFPEADVPFGRIMEPRNFSEHLSPKDKTSLLIEFFCWENDWIWNSSREDLFKLSIDFFEKKEFFSRREVIDIYTHKEKFAYPVYDLNYKNYLCKINDYLSQFQNLHCIGRSGSFRYNNQDEAMEMGVLAARKIDS